MIHRWTRWQYDFEVFGWRSRGPLSLDDDSQRVEIERDLDWLHGRLLTEHDRIER